MTLGIVRELVAIEELLEQVENRAMGLSLRLVSYADDLDRQAMTPGAKAAVADSVRVARDVAARAAPVAESMGPLRWELARAVRLASELLAPSGHDHTAGFRGEEAGR